MRPDIRRLKSLRRWNARKPYTQDPLDGRWSFLKSGSAAFFHGEPINVCPFNLKTDPDRVKKWTDEYVRAENDCAEISECCRCDSLACDNCQRDKAKLWRYEHAYRDFGSDDDYDNSLRNLGVDDDDL